MILFSVLLGLAAATGLVWVAWQAAPKQAEASVEMGLLALVGALAGARAAYVSVNLDYYKVHLAEVPQVWLGGLSAPGALAGAFLALVIGAVLSRRSLGRLADSLLPLAACLSVAAWLACWLDGCAYGFEGDGWWALPVRDEWGAVSHRVPVQLVGALSALVWFWLIDRIRHRLYWAGQAASLGLLGLSLEFMALSWLRADPGQVWHGLRLEAWGAAALVITAVIGFGATYLQKSQRVSGGRLAGLPLTGRAGK